MKNFLWGALGCAVMLAGCDTAAKPGDAGQGVSAVSGETASEQAQAAAPIALAGTVLDLASAGMTANGSKEISGAGMKVIDTLATDHQMAFWSLSDIQPNKNYTFRMKVKKDAASQVAGLLQIDMQYGAKKSSFECPFQLYDGQAAGRNAAAGAAVTMEDVGDSYVITCPAQSGPKTDAIYPYIAPSIGPANGSYDPGAIGSVVVEEIAFEVSPMASAPVATPPATEPTATPPAN
jgi:hypothetical protein